MCDLNYFSYAHYMIYVLYMIQSNLSKMTFFVLGGWVWGVAGVGASAQSAGTHKTGPQTACPAPLPDAVWQPPVEML